MLPSGVIEKICPANSREPARGPTSAGCAVQVYKRASDEREDIVGGSGASEWRPSIAASRPGHWCYARPLCGQCRAFVHASGSERLVAELRQERATVQHRVPRQRSHSSPSPPPRRPSHHLSPSLLLTTAPARHHHSFWCCCGDFRSFFLCHRLSGHGQSLL